MHQQAGKLCTKAYARSYSRRHAGPPCASPVLLDAARGKKCAHMEEFQNQGWHFISHFRPANGVRAVKRRPAQA
jgi:hypothetical protein